MRLINGTEVLETLEELVDPKHACLIVVDMQNDFASPRGGLAGDYLWVEKIIPGIKRVLEAARQIGLPIVFTKMVTSRDGSRESGPRLRFVDKISPTPDIPRYVEGSWGAEVIDELRPLPNEIQMIKYRSSSLIATPLDMMLRNRGIKSAVVVGLSTWACVEATVRDLNQFGYYPVVLSDCVAARQQELHDAALLLMSTYGDLASSDDVLAIWRTAVGAEARRVS